MTVAEQILQAKDDYDAVYDTGYANGKSEGGGDNFYNEFWDIQLDYGNKTNFNSAFYGNGWTDFTFNPNRPLRIKLAVSTFAASLITDYAVIAERIGGIDFTGCTSFNMTWQSSGVTRIGTVDFSSATASGALNATFNYCRSLKTIEKCIVCKENAFPNTFNNCNKLEYIRFEGEIGNNISFANSPNLSGASMLDAAAHLIDFSTTDPSEYPEPFAHTIIFSETACNKAFEEDEEFYTLMFRYTEARKWNLTTV